MNNFKKKINRLAVIPARLGSTRIKKKNIKLFDGKPIISYSILELKKSKIFKKIFVSTESKLIKKISENFGASVDFIRPESLSKDNVPLNLVLRNVFNEFKNKGELYDEIWMVYACNPLLCKQDILKAKNNFQKTPKTYPMMTMKEFEAPIEWAFERRGEKYKAVNKDFLFKDSKEIKKKYFECASFVIYTKEQLLNTKNHFNYYGYVMQNNRAIDIDNISDWQHALKLHNLNNKKFINSKK